MAEPLLSDIFGANATQTATQLIIDKADLDLIPTANNTPESLLVGVVKKALPNLSEQARSADPTNRQISFIDAGDQIYSDGANNYQIRSIALQLFRDYAIADINPEDY